MRAAAVDEEGGRLMKKKVLVRKRSLHDPEVDDLKGKTPAELIGMVWQLTLDAWAFKEKLDAESRLQRLELKLKAWSYSSYRKRTC